TASSSCWRGRGRWRSGRPTSSIRTSWRTWGTASVRSWPGRACPARKTYEGRWGSADVLPNPLIVAADLPDPDQAESLAKRLSGLVAFVKVGLTLFVSAGPVVVERVRAHAPVFLDLKLHDIPHQVRGAAAGAARLGAGLLTVHALGGPDMVRAAVEGAAEGARTAGVDPPAVLAVTVLSSRAGEGLASTASLAFA